MKIEELRQTLQKEFGGSKRPRCIEIFNFCYSPGIFEEGEPEQEMAQLSAVVTFIEKGDKSALVNLYNAIFENKIKEDEVEGGALERVMRKIFG